MATRPKGPQGCIGWYVLVMAVWVFVPGCALLLVGAGAAGTVAYVRGDLEGSVPESIAAVCVATGQAMEEMGLVPEQNQCDALTGEITAHNAQGKKITVKLNRTESDQTAILVRVGTFGDQQQSQAIYDKIKEKL